MTLTTNGVRTIGPIFNGALVSPRVVVASTSTEFEFSSGIRLDDLACVHVEMGYN